MYTQSIELALERRALLISFQRNLDSIGAKALHYYLLKSGCRSSLLFVLQCGPKDSSVADKIMEFILEKRPHVIGMSLLSVQYDLARTLTRALKVRGLTVPILWGGIHPSIDPVGSLQDADLVCMGEGERCLVEVASSLASGRNVESVPNLSLVKDGRYLCNPLYPPFEDLDELPATEHVPRDSYIYHRGRIIPLEVPTFRHYAPYGGRSYSIITSRGCPYACTYCCNNFLSKLYRTRHVRHRSVNSVLGELRRAIFQHPYIEQINIHDDSFLQWDSGRLADFCKRFRDEIKRPFIARTIPNYLTPEKLRMMKSAGLAWVSVGLQSGSERVLRDVYRRRSLLKDFRAATQMVAAQKVAAFYDVIVDNPFEDDDDRLETVRTLADTPRPFYMQLLSLTLYPGTELYERAKRERQPGLEDYLRKNYHAYASTPINALTRVAVFAPRLVSRALARLYETAGPTWRTRVAIGFCKYLSAVVWEPLTYLRVVSRSQGNRPCRVLRVVPMYFSEGFRRYRFQFRAG